MNACHPHVRMVENVKTELMAMNVNVQKDGRDPTVR